MKILVKFGVFFSTPYLVMNLVLNFSKENIGKITDMDQHLFVKISIREGCVFHRHRILETDPTGQHTEEKLDAFFLDKKSFYLSATSHYSLACGNYQWLNNSRDPNFPTLLLLMRTDHKDGLLELMVKYL